MNILNDKDRNSDTWTKIEEYLKKRINTLRESNDDPKLTESETVNIRAEIKVIKNLLSVTVKKDLKIKESETYS